MKRPVSITLDEGNLLWLKGQAAATTRGNVSEIVDRLIAQARTGGAGDIPVRSVIGTIDLPGSAIEEADGYVRALFDRSLSRPMPARERPPTRTQRRRG